MKRHHFQLRVSSESHIPKMALYKLLEIRKQFSTSVGQMQTSLSWRACFVVWHSHCWSTAFEHGTAKDIWCPCQFFSWLLNLCVVVHNYLGIVCVVICKAEAQEHTLKIESHAKFACVFKGPATMQMRSLTVC